MKLHRLVYLPLMAGAMISAVALAQNTITFTGTLEEPTCSVAMDGSNSMSVSLGKLDKFAFSKVLYANHTPFKIKLTGCPTNRNPFAYFYTSAENITDWYKLINTHKPSDKAAKGIALVISFNDKEGTIYSINKSLSAKSSRSGHDPVITPDKDGNAELTYRAVFNRTAKYLDDLIPGEFTTTVNFVIHYD